VYLGFFVVGILKEVYLKERKIAIIIYGVEKRKAREKGKMLSTSV
jgi:hypothetical protein